MLPVLKKDDITIFLVIVNFEVHPNYITGSRVTAILPIGGASTVEGLRSTGLSRLVSLQTGV